MAWAYPRLFAHRGAGRFAPENTLAALVFGFQQGYRAVEFDVMLSRDEVPVLMHDPDFGRTVAGRGRVSDTLAADLARMDAGVWFDARYTGEYVPAYVDAFRLCRERGIFMNVEIKPAPGYEERTGAVVASATRAYLKAQMAAGGGATGVLFSSFSSTALQAAMREAPEIARGHLFDRIPGDWQSRLKSLDCVALHCNHRHLEAAQVKAIHAAGYGVFCYTVNERERARELLDWGVDAFCTDEIEAIDAQFALR
jgi:glycerophosphoryl diester phosphodiesterase